MASPVIRRVIGGGSGSSAGGGGPAPEPEPEGIYVSNAGSDSNDGLSSSAPLETLSAAVGKNPAAGTSLFLRRGDTWAERLEPSTSGTSGNQITYGAYGSGAPPVITGNGTNSLNTNSNDYLTFYGLDFQVDGINVGASDSILFNYCMVRDCTGNGAYIFSTGDSTFNNCLVSGCAWNGVLVDNSADCELVNCTIIGNGSNVGGGLNAIKETTSGTVGYENCLITGNNTWQDLQIGGTWTDRGGNLIQNIPDLTAYNKNTAYFCLSFDDNDIGYVEDAVAELPSGHEATFFVTANIGAAFYSRIVALSDAGHEIAVHGYSHTFLTATTAFALTTTNTNATIDIDAAGETLTLAADELDTAFFTGSNNTQVPTGNSELITYQGQGSIDPGKTTTITAVEFDIHSITGSSQSWVAEIFDATTVNLGTQLDISGAETITGAGVVKFTGLSLAVTSGTSYHITIAPEDHNFDASNYIFIRVNTSASYSGNRMLWDSSKSRSTNQATQEVDITLYEANDIVVDWSVADKDISDLKTAVSGNGFTVTNTTNVNDALKLASLSDSSGAQSVPYTPNLDRTAPDYAFFREEIDDSIAIIITDLTNSVAPTTMAWPGAASDSTVIDYVQGETALIGSRMAENRVQWLNSVPVYDVYSILASNANFKGDGSETDIRAAARHAYILAMTVGGIHTLYAHNATELSPTQIGWYSDELDGLGVTLQTFGSIMTAVRSSHSTADDLLYTKTYTDELDGNLLAGSDCIDAGTDVSLTEDIIGISVPQGTDPDIGPYEAT